MNLPIPYEQAGSSTLDAQVYLPGVSFAETPSGSSGDNPKRPRTGCLTCRLRKKRCDEQKPICATCDRLGIECLGYEKHRPTWLRTDESKKKAKQDWKKQIRTNRQNKARAAREGSEITTVPVAQEQPTPLPTTSGFNASNTVTTNDTHSAEGAFSAYNPQHNQQMMYSTESGNASFPPSGWTGTGQPQHSSHMNTTTDLTITNSTDMTTFPTFPSFPDTGFEDVWTLIFGQPPGSPGPPAQPFIAQPSPTVDNSLLSFFSPPPPTDAGSPQPDLTYLHHYLNVVLPLQYRFVVKALAELVAPLALNNAEILKSTSSLAALHLAAQRAKHRPALPWDPNNPIENDANVDEAYAVAAHRQSIERIRFVSAEDLTSEEVVLPTLFALSFHLFLGGTSRDWPDVLATSRRCLSAALTNSPEFTTGITNSASAGTPSPWQRYRPLISAMVWMDIVGSVSQNKPSRLLPMYRSILGQTPTAYGTAKRTKLHMERVMGCDDTTFLAIAETVQLSEWRDASEDAGCLSLKDLLHRAASIEKILDERSWRENTLGGAEIVDEAQGKSDSDAAIIPVMAEIFFGAAKVLLASVVHGPYPRVPEVAGAVQETAEALHRLDIQYPMSDVNRSLIFPITIAGVHAESLAQQAFFRNRFATLGPEAAAFGNSKQALQLLEEVWKRRAEKGKGEKVCWRRTMKDLGWESGILLI